MRVKENVYKTNLQYIKLNNQKNLQGEMMKKFTFLFTLLFMLLLTINLQAQSGWNQQPCGTISTLIEVFATSPSVCYVTDPNDGLLKTTDGGNNWSFISIPNGCSYVTHLYFSSLNTGYISATYQNKIRILKTTNAGGNWTMQDIIFGFGLSKINFISDNIGWITNGSTADTVYKTTNGGNNWIGYCPQAEQLNNIFFTSADTGYLSTYGYFYKSVNGGINWAFVSTMGFNSIYFINSQTGWGTTYVTNLIMKTSNGGYNWIPQYNNGNSKFYNIYFVSSTNGYTSGDSGKIIFTSNAGLSWNIQQTEKKAKLYSVSFANTNTGWVVGDSGIILKTTTGGNPIGIEPINNNMPDLFQLRQNYPNPFNPSTTIEFDIPSTSFMKLIVYDNNGRVIQTLINEELKAGDYKVNFDGSGFSSGIYLYTLVTNTFSQTKRMVLLK